MQPNASPATTLVLAPANIYVIWKFRTFLYAIGVTERQDYEAPRFAACTWIAFVVQYKRSPVAGISRSVNCENTHGTRNIGQREGGHVFRKSWLRLQAPTISLEKLLLPGRRRHLNLCHTSAIGRMAAFFVSTRRRFRYSYRV